jgi:FkbM family methyltransferase
MPPISHVTPEPKEEPRKAQPSVAEAQSITAPCGGRDAAKVEDAALGYVTQVLLGEYLLPELVDIKTVLDIGANVGAFAMWARQMWPECELDCYEPMPETFDALRHNLRELKGVRGHRYAVTEIESPVMRKGVNTSGEDSIHDLGCQGEPTVPVRTIRPGDLPHAEFVKIDTEGCEVEIVRGILQAWKPKAFALEWHSYADRITLRRTLRNAGYKIGEYPNAIVSISKGQHIGIMKAVR